MKHEKLSADFLNRYVDHEMDAEERAETLALIQEDPALAEQVTDLYKLRELLRGAYAELPEPSPRRLPRMRRGLRWEAMAAGLLLALGGAGGWFAHDRLAPSATSGDRVAAVSAVEEVRKVMLHVSGGHPERVAEALDDAEGLLARFDQTDGQPVRLEVIANHDGVGLLLDEGSPFRDRVSKMAARYGDQRISFLACGLALERLRLMGRDVQLLPEARVIPSALDKIVDRLRQGWAYIKV